MRRTALISGSGAAALILLSTQAALAAEGDAGALFGMLPIVDEITVGDPADPHPIYEDPPGATQVSTILGQPARSMAMADGAKVFAYKIGAGKGLVREIRSVRIGHAQSEAVKLVEGPTGHVSVAEDGMKLVEIASVVPAEAELEALAEGE